MNTKRMLSVLISAVMLLSGVTAVSAAGTVVATIGDKGYSTLQSAFSSVNNGTIVLQDDVTLTSTARLNGRTATLDLNGKKISISGANTRAVYVGRGADLTVIGNNGEINAGQVAIECVGTSEKNKSTVTINGGSYNAQFSLFVGNYSYATVNDGTFSGYFYSNGQGKDCHFVINKGTFKRQFFLAAGYGSTYEINGGNFTETTESTVEIKGGTLTINGGTFTNTSDKQEIKYNGNGSSSEGYALAVLAQNGYQSAAAVVNGGTFNGYVDLRDVPKDDTEKVEVNSTLTINGGSYVNDISSYVPTGFKAIKIGDKYGIAEVKETEVTEVTEETTKEAVKEGLNEKVSLNENTTEKIETFSLSDLAAAYLVRATYNVSDGEKDGTVDVDFDLGNAEIGGSAAFGVVFYNVPDGITIGAPVISVAR